MAKNIALCFDGTWNDPDSNTNVIKMHRSIIGEDRTRILQTRDLSRHILTSTVETPG